jgi:hypothetical protein
MGSTESWVLIRDDGTIILHTENDGWTYLRRGPEAVEKTVSLEWLKNHEPNRYAEAVKMLKQREEKKNAPSLFRVGSVKVRPWWGLLT